MAWRNVRLALSGVTRRGVWLLIAVSAACASIPKHQYGIDTIVWSGMQAMEPDALATCIATRERDDFTLRLGFSAPECGEPPFASTAPALELWSWPWTRWPVFDPAIFNVDRERILRWYRARGFYGARILDVRAEADGQPVEGARCPTLSASQCKLKLHIQISEGAPIQIAALTLESHGRLPAALLASLRASLEQQAGSRFDEALYMGRQGAAEVDPR